MTNIIHMTNFVGTQAPAQRLRMIMKPTGTQPTLHNYTLFLMSCNVSACMVILK